MFIVTDLASLRVLIILAVIIEAYGNIFTCMAPITQHLEDNGMTEYEPSKLIKGGHYRPASKMSLNGVLLVDRL